MIILLLVKDGSEKCECVILSPLGNVDFVEIYNSRSQYSVEVIYNVY